MTHRSVLLILDGMGLSETDQGSAVTRKTMPTFFALAERQGCARLEASGPGVGLESGKAGNSEVGHVNIGAGRMVPGTLSRIDDAWASGEWAEAGPWESLAGEARLHLVVLLSDAGVHGHWRTAARAAQLAARHGVAEVFVHVVLDGVDSRAGSAPGLLDALVEEVAAIPRARIATVSGRKWACDRSGDLDLTRYCVAGLRGEIEQPVFSRDALAQHLEREGVESAFPFHVVDRDGFIARGEPVLLCSHRADRASQLAAVLDVRSVVYAMVPMEGGIIPRERVFFPTRPVKEGLVDSLREHGIRALRIAEECKFPHVTWFINGLRELPADTPAECIPSVPESGIAVRPEMSIEALCESVLGALRDSRNQALIVNIANLDQVGHTGRLDLAVRAAGAVDRALGRILEACRQHDWSAVITADHGNADCMLTPDGEPLGSHSANPVPLVVESRHGGMPLHGVTGPLALVAPVFLATLGLPAPRSMVPLPEGVAPAPAARAGLAETS